MSDLPTHIVFTDEPITEEQELAIGLFFSAFQVDKEPVVIHVEVNLKGVIELINLMGTPDGLKNQAVPIYLAYEGGFFAPHVLTDKGLDAILDKAVQNG